MSLWNIVKFHVEDGSPHRRIKKKQHKLQRTSFCTCIHASYTLEVAIVVPVLAAYIVSLLFFFSILEIQYKVDEALYYAGRKAAVESSVFDSSEILFLSTEAYFLYALQEDSVIDKYVKNGKMGIQLWQSDFDNEVIVLRAEYIVELPIRIGKIGEIKLSSQNLFRKWTGDRILEESEGYVYVALYGEVYHKNLSCRSINISVKNTGVENISSVRGKNGQRYKECLRCTWENENKERVYYTDYGELYHKNISCSSIKRSVDKISIEDIGDRRPCSFCYK